MNNETIYQTTSKNIFHVPIDFVAKSYAHDWNQFNCKKYNRGKGCTLTRARMYHHGAAGFTCDQGARGE